MRATQCVVVAFLNGRYVLEIEVVPLSLGPQRTQVHWTGLVVSCLSLFARVQSSRSNEGGQPGFFHHPCAVLYASVVGCWECHAPLAR